MALYETSAARIYYEEVGTGLPLLLIPALG